MTWYNWRQDDIPCAFSSQRTRENLEYLEKIIGPGYFQNVNSPTKNYLLRSWFTKGAVANIEINTLAEDLRLIDSKPGISFIIRDLRDELLCLPTWHTIHSASLFERARKGAVQELIDVGDKEGPDFIVKLNTDRIPVESKLLTQSKEQILFNSIAKKITTSIDNANLQHLAESKLILVLKKLVDIDVSKYILDQCLDAISQYKGNSVSVRNEICNIFIEPIKSPKGIAEYHWRYILAPVPESENIRVLQRAKKASKQLRAWPSTLDAGILSVGLTDYQDPSSIFTHISARIKQGRFNGISAVLLIKKRILLTPPIRTTLDLLEIRKNNRASDPISGKIPLRPFGAADLLTKVEPLIDGIRSYRFGVAFGRVIEPNKTSLFIPDIRVITKDMIT